MPNDLISNMKVYSENLLNDLTEKKNPNDLKVGDPNPDLQFFDSSLSDRFTAQKDYNPYGFNPFDQGNQNKWVNKETWGSALRKGFSSFGNSFGNTFVDYWKDYGRMIDAVVHLDWDKMNKSEPELMSQYFKDKLNADKNFVFVPQEDEDGIFNKKAMSEFIGNAGFMAGTSAAFFLEIAADTALAMLVGPEIYGASASRIVGQQAAKQAPEIIAKGLGKTIAKEAVEEGVEQIASKSNSFIKGLKQTIDGYFNLGNKSVDQIAQLNKIDNAYQEVKEIGRLRPGVNREAVRQSMKESSQLYGMNINNIIKSKSFSEMANNIVKGVPIVGQGFQIGEKIVTGAKAGLSTGQLVGMGAWGLKRIANVVNMAGTEAAFEGVTSYGETLNQIINQYEIDNNGAAVPIEFFNKAREAALKSSAANFNVNMGILLATNDIQFGNLYNRFLPNVKWASDIFKEGAEDIMVVRGKNKLGKKMFKEYVNGFWGTYGNIGNITKTYGPRQAVFEVGKSFMRTFGKFQVTEGLQENLQDMSSSFWRDHYAGQISGVQKTMRDNFDEAFAQQFSKQGLKTFLMGAFTGTLMAGPMHIAEQGMKKFQTFAAASKYGKEEKNPVYEAEKEFRKQIDVRNTFYENISNGKLEDIIFQMQGVFGDNTDMTDAAKLKNEYHWRNAHDNSILMAAWSANKSNMIDSFVQSIRDAGDDVTAEEFNKNSGQNLANTKYSSPKELFNKIADDIQKYSKVIDGLRDKVVTMTDPLMFRPGSKNFYTAAVMKNIQEDALKMIAFNSIKATMAAERAIKTSNDLSALPNIGRSSDYALKVLSNHENLIAEQGILMQELKQLEREKNTEGLDAARKKEITKLVKDKEEELELLQKWQKLWVTESYVTYEAQGTKEVNGKEVVNEVPIKHTSSEFKGIKIPINETIVEKDVNGNEVERKITSDYITKHPVIAELFASIMNIKNKQADINVELSNSEVFEGLDKITDYIKLEKDSKDYMTAIESLFVPENLRKLTMNMLDGKAKYDVIRMLDKRHEALQDNISFFKSYIEEYNKDKFKSKKDLNKLANEINEEFKNKILNIDTYKQLIAITLDSEFGHNNMEDVRILMKKFDEEQDKLVTEFFKKYGWPIDKETEKEEPVKEETVIPEEKKESEVIEEVEQEVEQPEEKTEEETAIEKSENTEGLDAELLALDNKREEELARFWEPYTKNKKTEIEKQRRIMQLRTIRKQSFNNVSGYINFILDMSIEDFNQWKMQNPDDYQTFEDNLSSDKIKINNYDKPLINLIKNKEDIDSVLALADEQYNGEDRILEKYEKLRDDIHNRYTQEETTNEEITPEDIIEEPQEKKDYDIETLSDKINQANEEELDNISKFAKEEGIYDSFKDLIDSRLDYIQQNNIYDTKEIDGQWKIIDLKNNIVLKKYSYKKEANARKKVAELIKTYKDVSDNLLNSPSEIVDILTGKESKTEEVDKVEDVTKDKEYTDINISSENNKPTEINDIIQMYSTKEKKEFIKKETEDKSEAEAIRITQELLNKKCK